MGTTLTSRDVIKALHADGWYEVNQVGDHKQYRHTTKKGRVTVQHPVKDLGIKIIRSIEEQSGLKLR
jgi:predicted RNA binding protein YcfA (HicA-like mRNA interferase family)